MQRWRRQNRTTNRNGVRCTLLQHSINYDQKQSQHLSLCGSGSKLDARCIQLQAFTNEDKVTSLNAMAGLLSRSKCLHWRTSQSSVWRWGVRRRRLVRPPVVASALGDPLARVQLSPPKALHSMSFNPVPTGFSELFQL